MGHNVQHQRHQQHRFVPAKSIHQISGDGRTQTGRPQQRQIDGCNFAHRQSETLHVHRQVRDQRRRCAKDQKQGHLEQHQVRVDATLGGRHVAIFRANVLICFRRRFGRHLAVFLAASELLCSV
uniref:(northern house mosquito) hypothetical protein n=1 Tax=Culex pipiens TaxID=7175 RepID=A0A8D8CL59_CULPI